MNELEEYYGKYNEEKRLLRVYGQIEYRTTMHYIHELLTGNPTAKIADIGPGTGRYTIPLAEEGYNLTAVELVNYNLGILKQKAEREKLTNVTAFQGNALDLHRLSRDSFDLVLLLGPLYHLFKEEEKIQALKEAKRIVKPDGKIIAGYIMNEYAVVMFGAKEGHLLESISKGKLDSDFHVRNSIEDLFSFDRTEDIVRYREAAGLCSVKLVSQDGPTNYIRPIIEEMREEAFEMFYRYHLSTCERPDLIGAGCHTIDILYKSE